MSQKNRNTKRGNTVVLYDPGETDVTIEFTNALCRRLECEFNYNVVINRNGESDHSRSTPKVIVCYNYSRLGTDIDSALAKLPVSGWNKSEIAIAVLHAKEEHALPQTMPTESLYDVKFEQYGVLFDYAFMPKSNFYDCEMNTIADQKLGSFLETCFHRKQMIASTAFQEMRKKIRNISIGIVVIGIIVLAVVVALLVYESKAE